VHGSNLAHGLASVAWPSGKIGPQRLGHDAAGTYPRRGHYARGRRGGAAADGAALAEMLCSLLGGHQRGKRGAPGNRRGGGTHLSGLSTTAGGDEATHRSSSRAAVLR
jgi:hypothetical protein